MRLPIVILLTSIFLGGCTAPSKKPLNTAYLAGPVDPKVKSEKMIQELTRGYSAMGFYQMEAYPFTKTIIEAKAREEGTKNLDPEKRIQMAIATKQKALAGSETCLMFRVGTLSIDSAQFKYWIAKLEDHTGKLSDITFSNVSGVDSIPYAVQGSMSGFTWFNSSTGCTKQIDLAKGFKVHVIPQIGKDAPRGTMEWLSPHNTTAAN